MEKKKKDLAKAAFAALMLAATSLPVAGQAETSSQEVFLAALACGAGSGSNWQGGQGGRPANCGASNGAYQGGSYQGNRPANCGASSGAYQGGSYQGNRSANCGAATSSTGNSTTGTSGYSRPTTTGGSDAMNSTGTSSYQGTTTGPGPNDGYPGTPRGSYNTNATNPNSPSSSSNTWNR